MRFREKRRPGGWLRMLSAVMAVMMCFLLVLQVSAASVDGETTAPEESTEATAAVETTQGSSITRIDTVTMQEALDNIKAVVDDLSVYGVDDALFDAEADYIEKGDAGYAREDVYNAALECYDVLIQAGLVKDGIAELRSALLAHPNLTEELMISYGLMTVEETAEADGGNDGDAENNNETTPAETEPVGIHALEAKAAACYDDAVRALIAMLQNPTDSTVAQKAAVISDAGKTLDDAEKLVASLPDVLGAMPLLEGAAAQLEQIKAVIMPDGPSAEPNTAETLYQELAGELDKRKADIAGYFDLPADTAATLAKAMESLNLRVAQYPMLLAKVNAANDAQQDALLDALMGTTDGEGERVDVIIDSHSPLFAYIALGVAVLALLMGIVAAVCTLRKPKDDGIDVSRLATRDAIESIDRQNQRLKETVKLVMERVDQPAADAQIPYELLEKVNEITRQLEQLAQDVEALKRDDAPQPPPPPPPPPPPTPCLTEVCRLGLNQYQLIDPTHIQLRRMDNGQFVLYSDDTVGIADSVLTKCNELKSWRDSGLLYVFALQIDGKLVSMDKELPGGYYGVDSVTARAKVEKSVTNGYTLMQVGCVNMKKQF